MKASLVVVFALACTLCVASATLFGVTGQAADQPETLFVIDQSNGQGTAVLSLEDGGRGEALAYGGDTKLLYHWSGDAGSVQFQSIDPVTYEIVETFPASSAYGESIAAATEDFDDDDFFLVVDRENSWYSVDSRNGAVQLLKQGTNMPGGGNGSGGGTGSGGSGSGSGGDGSGSGGDGDGSGGDGDGSGGDGSGSGGDGSGSGGDGSGSGGEGSGSGGDGSGMMSARRRGVPGTGGGTGGNSALAIKGVEMTSSNDVFVCLSTGADLVRLDRTNFEVQETVPITLIFTDGMLYPRNVSGCNGLSRDRESGVYFANFRLTEGDGQDRVLADLNFETGAARVRGVMSDVFSTIAFADEPVVSVPTVPTATVDSFTGAFTFGSGSPPPSSPPSPSTSLSVFGASTSAGVRLELAAYGVLAVVLALAVAL